MKCNDCARPIKKGYVISNKLRKSYPTRGRIYCKKCGDKRIKIYKSLKKSKAEYQKLFPIKISV